jgi:hypothetical protein
VVVRFTIASLIPTAARRAIEGRLDRDAYDAVLEREDDLHTELEEKLED